MTLGDTWWDKTGEEAVMGTDPEDRIDGDPICTRGIGCTPECGLEDVFIVSTTASLAGPNFGEGS